MPTLLLGPLGRYVSGHEVALVVFDGRSARVVLERSLPAAKGVPGEDVDGSPPGLAIVVDHPLTDESST
jgi:hypothetical protein